MVSYKQEKTGYDLCLGTERHIIASLTEGGFVAICCAESR